MDTSPEYIQMCGQAKEIQEQWKPQIGDFYKGYQVNVICMDELIQAITNDIKEHKADSWVTFLPRQDQLQAILDDIFSNRDLVPLTAQLHIFCIKVIKELHFKGRTMEQLWLAFLMYDKYRKIWNSSDWVAE